MTYRLTNRQKRAWVVPATADDSHKSILVDPGETVTVDRDHWDTVRKGNLVIDALLSDRHLVVETGSGDAPVLHAEELRNPASPVAPEELGAETPGVHVESKGIEEVTEPGEVKPVRRK